MLLHVTLWATLRGKLEEEAFSLCDPTAGTGTSGSGHEPQDESLLWSGDLVGRLEHLLGSIHLVPLHSTNSISINTLTSNMLKLQKELLLHRTVSERFFLGWGCCGVGAGVGV